MQGMCSGVNHETNCIADNITDKLHIRQPMNIKITSDNIADKLYSRQTMYTEDMSDNIADELYVRQTMYTEDTSDNIADNLYSRQSVEIEDMSDNITDKLYIRQAMDNIPDSFRLQFHIMPICKFRANETIVLVHFKLPKKSNQQIVTAFLSLKPKHSPRLLMFGKNRQTQITQVW